MNGADSLLKLFQTAKLRTVFANPGTSELHFVSALERSPGMRGVLCLFEGVATGAADGYARMTGTPAPVLLHLGPGLANGWANVHNARKARSPMLLVVGDHATWHKGLDAPLESDVVGLARSVSDWVGVAEVAEDVAPLGAEALKAAMSRGGQVASLVLCADAAWDPVFASSEPLAPERPAPVADTAVEAAASALRTAVKPALLLGGAALRGKGLAVAARLGALGIRLYADTFVPRLERGAGRPMIVRLPYFPELVDAALADVDTLVMAGTKAPVSFFAYPDRLSQLTPPDARPVDLCGPREDVVDALERLADRLGAPSVGDAPQAEKAAGLFPALARPELASGKLTTDAVGRAFAHYLPEEAIVSDDSTTGGLESYLHSATAPPHDWLCLMGGSIGQGLPLACGAAVAAPDRKVVSLQSDGAGMYTLQALWTMARERLDVTTIILANRAYAILDIEMQRLGITAIPNQLSRLFDLADPELQWAKLAEGMGVEAVRVTSAEDFNAAIADFVRRPGPNLIEAVL